MYVMTHIMYFVKSFSLVIVLGILMYEKLYLSIYLQKSNARVIMKKLTLLTSDSASIFVDDVNTQLYLH